MNEGISVITATGDRPVGLTLLAGYLARQTYRGPLEWVVVDDGTKPFTPDVESLKSHFAPFSLRYIRRAEPTTLGGSLQRNMIVALRNTTGANIICMEDDDWYREDYLDTMLGYLKTAPLVGETNANYYNVESRLWRVMGNTNHASLCQTAWKSSENGFVDSCCRDKSYMIDLRMWKQTKNGRLFKPTGASIGIKGTPGRRGLTKAHRPTTGDFKPDLAMARLQNLIGADYHTYAPMYPYHIPSWWEWIGKQPKDGWTVLGKGPSFEPTTSGLTIALNTTCLRMVEPPTVVHMVDLDVLNTIADWLRSTTTMLVVPWHPHENYRPGKQALPEVLQDGRYAVLDELRKQGRLLCYHASNHQRLTKAPADSPVVPLRFFSAEAVFGLLAIAGAKEIRSCGVDGGKEYSEVFAGTTLMNGRNSFDAQMPEIRRTLEGYSTKWVRL